MQEFKREVSIVICFFNGGEKLRPTIEHIKAMDISSCSGVELIFIDNNSKDNSVEIINEELKAFDGFPWRVIPEEKAGLAYARLTGFANAKYDTILFCDDDNWLSPSYLTLGLNILEGNNNIAVLGGKGEAVSDVEIPSWFEEKEAFFAVGPQMPATGKVIGERNVVYGAGMMVRKAYFEGIQSKGFEFYNLGRTGGKVTSGEDSEMCLAFQIAGYDIWYDERLSFKHYMEPRRLDLGYFKTLSRGMQSSRYIARFYLEYMQGYVPEVGSLFWLKEFMFSFKDFLKFLVKGDRTNYKRNLDLCSFLLSERSAYNQKVQKIIDISNALSK